MLALSYVYQLLSSFRYLFIRHITWSVWTVRVSQEIGYLSNEIGEVVMVSHTHLRQAGTFLSGSEEDAMHFFFECQRLRNWRGKKEESLRNRYKCGSTEE